MALAALGNGFPNGHGVSAGAAGGRRPVARDNFLPYMAEGLCQRKKRVTFVAACDLPSVAHAPR